MIEKKCIFTTFSQIYRALHICDTSVKIHNSALAMLNFNVQKKNFSKLT